MSRRHLVSSQCKGTIELEDPSQGHIPMDSQSLRQADQTRSSSSKIHQSHSAFQHPPAFRAWMSPSSTDKNSLCYKQKPVTDQDIPGRIKGNCCRVAAFGGDSDSIFSTLGKTQSHSVFEAQ